MTSTTTTTTTKTTTRDYNSIFLSPAPAAGAQDEGKEQAALIILNSPIAHPPSPVLTHLWKSTSFHVCADGGANRLMDATMANPWLPDCIVGDLDSIRSEVRSYYESQGVVVKHVADQNGNDLDKALHVVRKQDDTDGKQQCNRVYVYGAFGGRLDQEMASLQALFQWALVFDYAITLYNDENVAFLLPPHVPNHLHLARDDDRTVTEGPTCGLLPVGSACDSVVTGGLEWNLDGSIPLQFGGLISTSNRIVEPVVTVTTSQALLFTAEVQQAGK